MRQWKQLKEKLLRDKQVLMTRLASPNTSLDQVGFLRGQIAQIELIIRYWEEEEWHND